MIFAYGTTLRGAYHVKDDTLCQDAHLITKCGDSFAIAAVADGVGSELYTDIASKIAVKSSSESCKEGIAEAGTDEEIIQSIRHSFKVALADILNEAEKNGHPDNQYDTTLCLAVLIDDTLYYGQSGDSGIVALTVDGTFEKVTSQQRDEDGCVFPLCFEDHWVFGKFDKKVSSVLVATDGMLEPLFPYLLKGQATELYTALASYFIDNRRVQIEVYGEEYVQKQVEEFLSSIPETVVNDDKTVACLINCAVKTQYQPDEYYAEPDWNELKRKKDEEWRRIAYPHLYNKCEPINQGKANDNFPASGGAIEFVDPEATANCEESGDNGDN